MSSKGPEVTITLSWIPSSCHSSERGYYVSLCLTRQQGRCLSGTTTGHSLALQSTASLPVVFWNNYTATVYTYCSGWQLWTQRTINTGPGGELKVQFVDSPLSYRD